MGLVRTVTNVTAGGDITETWGDQVYADVGSIINYRIVYTESDGATVTFNLNNSAIQLVTLGGNRTLAVSNAIDGQTFFLILKQDVSGNRVPTWFSSIQWAYGVTPTLTTTGGKYDVFAFIKVGSIYLGFIVAQNL